MNKKTEITLEFERYNNDWRVNFLKFVIKLLGFRETGGSKNRWTETLRFTSKKYKLVEEK